MSKTEALEFALTGDVAGQPISTREGLPFSQFAEFNEEVQKYIVGTDTKAVLHDVMVQISEGSYLLRVIIPAGLLPSLISDTAKVSVSGSAGDIDPVRAKVVFRWQERAKMDQSLKYTVRSSSGNFQPVEITAKSDFKKEDPERLVDVERYIIGEITDWGGAQSVNVHVRPRNTREVIIVSATADQIRGQRENLVFRKAIVHVRAKQNMRTGALEKYRLVELRAYEPTVSDAQLQQLFEKGSKAWNDVTDSNQWVEELRGGSSS